MEKEKDRPIPPLRGDVEPVPVDAEGRKMFALHDPEGIAKKTVALSPAGMALATIFDGRHTAEDIRTFLRERMKVELTLEQILSIALELEKEDLLETEKVFLARKRILDEFLKSPVRKATLAGSGYPEKPSEVSSLFAKLMVEDPAGPKKPVPEKPVRKAPPVGLVAPHIDFERGGPVYAKSYQALSECPPPDLVVALGVAHASPDSPWTLTRKDYDTPYGPMKTSPELYRDFKDLLWYDPAADEWVHRREHSLEFQALWLKSLWGEKAPPWLPVLVSSFERFCTDKAPSSIETVEKALSTLGTRLAKRAKRQRLMILAGVDLAHVGPKFGDELELTPELRKKIEAEDRATLAKALALDADGFYLSGAGEGSWRHLCGLSALYTAVRWMKALGAEPGTLLGYAQGDDPQGGVVSFASALFEKKT